jgi:cold-inducible RNA-binding protein
MVKRLYVGNLAFNTRQIQLKDLFSQVGEIAEINLITDRYTGTPKGFAYIEMVTEEAAQEAVKRFDGYLLDGRKLNVSEARPRAEGSGSGYLKKSNRF